MTEVAANLSTNDLREESPLLMERRGSIVLLTLNRPKARNALSDALLDALSKRLTEIAGDRTAQAVVIDHAPPVFSAGHDLRELTAHRGDPDGGRGFYEKVMRKCAEVMQQIVHLPQPVIAAVSGTATAAGCQLVASCDLAVAAEEAKFATPGVNIGLFCSSPMVALSRNVSRKHAMEMLLTGEMIDAHQAAQYGLVNRVVEAGGVQEAAFKLAEKIAAKSPAIVAIGKEAFYRQAEMPLSQAYDYAAGVMVANMMEPDAEEGIGAFLEKRKPEWKGR
ncbi:enoyl-CoA hydratase [Dichotomicrobium thermohalophilum]|uniref:Enoyl-CoA hydratase domain-containing protein 3, mitochondrial n=1 Tax=Dichotomicrobium thermohalophilum TaxID=933063 RepID=A0A397Q7Y7_9HYPH|nr:enoyl-CoA hydratase [Dichotomicrobium thermohalophilum]RIA55935.1 enoyl-CoA hydratase/carnithine racemase [Dichotomicrobium thermohalophilum]